MPIEPAAARYLREIDGLRAVAVISVLLFHLKTTFLPGGFTGVDVFFVISGYVVSKSLASRAAPGLPQYLLGFYARRIARILPALIVCLVLVSLATVLLVPELWPGTAIPDAGLWAFWGVSNFALLAGSGSYFTPDVRFNPFVHTWSLGVEEQFYLLFPMLLFVWLVWQGSTGGRKALAWVLVPVLALASMAAAYAMQRVQPDLAFYLLPARFWELAAGALLFMAHARGRLLPRSGRAAGLWVLAGAVLILAGFRWSDYAGFPLPWALPPTLGALLVIIGVAAQGITPSPLHRLLRSAVFTYVGRISYSLYLWHWPVFVLFRWTVGLETPAAMALAVLLAFALASASYHVVEQPIRRAARPGRAAGVILAGVAAIALAFTGTRTLYDNRATLSLSVTRDTATWYPARLESAPTPDGAPAGRQLFVFGDDHSAAYGTLLRDASAQPGLQVHLQTSERCGIANLRFPLAGVPDCRAVTAGALDVLRQQAKPGDVVFLASRRMYAIGDRWNEWDIDEAFSRVMDTASTETRARAATEAAAFIRAARDLKLTIVLNAPKPVFPTPPFRCSDKFNRANPRCISGFDVERGFLLALREPVMDSLRALQAEFDDLLVWDAFETLCAEDFCSPFDGDGNPLYFDGNQLSGRGNRVLQADFRALLRDALSRQND